MNELHLLQVLIMMQLLRVDMTELHLQLEMLRQGLKAQGEGMFELRL